MDINSIGSMTRMAGVSPIPAQSGAPGNAQNVARETAGTTGIDQTPPNAVAARPAGTAENQTRNDTEQDRRQKLQDSVEALNEFISPHNTSLRFSIDDESGTVVVKVTDKETKEVIKHFPSEEALELAKALDKLKGLLVQQKV